MASSFLLLYALAIERKANRIILCRKCAGWGKILTSSRLLMLDDVKHSSSELIRCAVCMYIVSIVCECEVLEACDQSVRLNPFGPGLSRAGVASLQQPSVGEPVRLVHWLTLQECRLVAVRRLQAVLQTNFLVRWSQCLCE